MNDYIYNLTLDLNCNKSSPVIDAAQFDKGRKLKVTVTSDGEAYPLTGASVSLVGKNSDGTTFNLICTVNADGTATALTDEFTFSSSGLTRAKLIITDSSRSYSTQTFLIDVDGALIGFLQSAEGYVNTVHLVDGAVTTEKIATRAVTAAKIAQGAVTGVQIYPGVVEKNHLHADLQSEIDGKLDSSGILITTGALAPRTPTFSDVEPVVTSAAYLCRQIGYYYEIDFKIVFSATLPAHGYYDFVSLPVSVTGAAFWSISGLTRSSTRSVYGTIDGTWLRLYFSDKTMTSGETVSGKITVYKPPVSASVDPLRSEPQDESTEEEER